jgi:hypothetical protein
LGTQRKGNVCGWKLLPSNGSEDLIVDMRGEEGREGERERACALILFLDYLTP